MNKIVVLALIVASLMQFACRSTSVGPQEKDYHNRILFTSRRSGNQQLSMMNPDGSNVEQITSGQFEHWAGRWSPDAEKIVCNTSEGWSTAGEPIVVFNVDGTGRKLIGAGGAMAWSPDARKIAYSYTPYGELGINASYIYVFGADGMGASQFTAGDVIDDGPEWTKDEQRILFTSNRSNPTKSSYQIYSIAADGGSSTRLTQDLSASFGAPRISPDGNQIVTKTIWKDSSGITFFTFSGAILKVIREDQGMYNLIVPRWSPDGTMFVRAGFLTQTTNTFLCTMTIDGTNFKIVSGDDGSASYPDWSR